MQRDSYSTAELLGTFQHPQHLDSNDWTVRLYRAADELVFETNGDPVWETTNPSDFAALVMQYGINIEEALSA